VIPKEDIPPGAEVGVDALATGESPLGELSEGIGGKDSNNDVPKDDEGLNALSPLKPVVCGLSAGDNDSGGGLDVAVAPVG